MQYLSAFNFITHLHSYRSTHLSVNAICDLSCLLLFSSIIYFYFLFFLYPVVSFCCLFILFQLLVATIGVLFSSIYFICYELAERTTVESLSPTLRPADRVTMLAVTSHFSRRHGGLYINSWSPRDFPSIRTLSVSCFVSSLYDDVWVPRLHHVTVTGTLAMFLMCLLKETDGVSLLCINYYRTALEVKISMGCVGK